MERLDIPLSRTLTPDGVPDPAMNPNFSIITIMDRTDLYFSEMEFLLHLKALQQLTKCL